MLYPFIVKQKRGYYFQAERVRSSFEDVNRTKRVIGNLFREVEHDHWNKNRLSIRTAYQNGMLEGHSVLGRGGFARANAYGNTVPATAAGVKSVVRRLRPQEAELIAEVDDDIKDLQQQIGVLRKKRDALVAVAWTRGHTVHLKEVVPEVESEAKILSE